MGGSDLGGFQLSSISVQQNEIWKINRRITFVFTAAVNFNTVNLNTISIRDENDVPANGVFSQGTDPRVIDFQPNCPVKSDFTDAGLLPGGRKYTIHVLGQNGGQGIAVASTGGALLKVSQTRSFFTPASAELGTLFHDAVEGAPLPVIRMQGSSALNATFIEVADEATVSKRIYFERLASPVVGCNNETMINTQPGTGDGSLVGHPLEMLEVGMPLNLYSDVQSQLSFLLEVNQPVNPGPENINSARLRLEAERTLCTGDFRTLPALVELVSNCTVAGATVRITPQGVLPQDVRLRLVVAAEFEDLVGERHLAPIDNFAIIRTETVGSDLADEILEEFVAGAPVLGSFEDPDAPFAEPRAIWGGGSLSPRFDFEGTGGPSNAFDFRVRVAGGAVSIDTTFSVVSNDIQTLSQTIVNGRMDVRNFTVDPGATLRLSGPNPMFINATGTVRIDGTIELRGLNAKNVAGVNTANQPEQGAAGSLGGGRGGHASEQTNQSTARGGTGAGAFGVPGLGGKGGETGFGKNAPGHPELRRGAGGGGGVLGPNQIYGPMGPMKPTNTTGTAAQTGAAGSIKAKGALTGGQPQGGDVGTSPFLDSNPANDFFGIMFVASTGEIVRGELPKLWAGQGGGGGGDCVLSNVFPHPNFTPSTDDKGGAGGGGSGGMRIRALGDVVFGATGKIIAEGGIGALGQVVQFGNDFFWQAGPSGGGGSGGHVIIETAKTIDFGTAFDVISARGGAGGPGTAPAGSNKLQNARGGDGGPGIVQLHTPNGVADIFFTQPLDLTVVPAPILLVPNFGRISRARSLWIPLGGAVGTNPDDVTFMFEGTDPMTGNILATAGVVDDLPEIIGPATLSAAGTPRIVDDHTLVFDFVNDVSTMFDMNDFIYRDNPVLMKNFVILLRDAGAPATQRRYNVEVAMEDPTDPNRMLLSTPSSALPFSEFTGTPAAQVPDVANVEFLLIPRYFRVVTSGTGDSLPASSSISVSFEGTGATFDGNPDTANILVPSTTDITDLFDPSLAAPIRFFRYEVEFNIDVGGTTLSAASPRPALDFLRIPFRF